MKCYQVAFLGEEMLSATRVRVKESGTKAWNVSYYQRHMICYCCVAIGLNNPELFEFRVI